MSREYIDIDDNIYGVKKYDKDTKLKKGFAYKVKKKFVLPYYGKADSIKNKKPGIYLVDNEVKILKPINKKAVKKYSVDRIYSNDKKDINKILSEFGVKNNENLPILLSDTEDVFAPAILDSDNPLQILIKKALAKQQIDIKNYLPSFKSPSDLSNKKRSLCEHGKMSFERFTDWVDILQYGFEIRLFDSPDSVNPIGEEIVFRYEK